MFLNSQEFQAACGTVEALRILMKSKEPFDFGLIRSIGIIGFGTIVSIFQFFAVPPPPVPRLYDFSNFEPYFPDYMISRPFPPNLPKKK